MRRLISLLVAGLLVRPLPAREPMPLLVVEPGASQVEVVVFPVASGAAVELWGAAGPVARGGPRFDVTEITGALIAREGDATGGWRWSNPVVLGEPAPRAPVALQGIGGLALAPPAGSVINAGGVQVRGTVTGSVPPYRVTFFLDGLLTSRLTALPTGQTFAHGITLVGEGSHIFEVESRDAAGVTGRMTAGTITLDRTPPPPPIVLAPMPGSSTNQDLVTLSGRLAELDANPGNAQFPAVTIVVGGGVRVEPSATIRVTDPAGLFSARLNLTGLPDGVYPVRLIAQDEAGNFSSAAADTSVGVSAAPRTSVISVTSDDEGLASLRRHLLETRRSGARGARRAEDALRALQSAVQRAP